MSFQFEEEDDEPQLSSKMSKLSLDAIVEPRLSLSSLLSLKAMLTFQASNLRDKLVTKRNILRRMQDLTLNHLDTKILDIQNTFQIMQLDFEYRFNNLRRIRDLRTGTHFNSRKVQFYEKVNSQLHTRLQKIDLSSVYQQKKQLKALSAQIPLQMLKISKLQLRKVLLKQIHTKQLKLNSLQAKKLPDPNSNPFNSQITLSYFRTNINVQKQKVQNLKNAVEKMRVARALRKMLIKIILELKTKKLV
ncbi:Hypothetical_protein [Hexamita inflata]|uniref:Hypothetical_protein n=1 Tax=Hexamita inflata TaxID=28002 RepID=A0AA86V6Z1_9EUKA|nr:Hypothetical protein HINF_LOCUS66332 [Hexamita inflata]